MVPVVPDEGLDPGQDVIPEALGDPVDAAAGRDPRKVPRQDEETIGEPRRLAGDVQAAEDLVEVAGMTEVVVGRQGAEPQRLAETPRSQEDQDASQPLDLPNVGRSIDVNHAVAADALKVGDTVGKLDHGVFVPHGSLTNHIL